MGTVTACHQTFTGTSRYAIEGKLKVCRNGRMGLSSEHAKGGNSSYEAIQVPKTELMWEHQRPQNCTNNFLNGQNYTKNMNRAKIPDFS